jgi:hypothetical protein
MHSRWTAQEGHSQTETENENHQGKATKRDFHGRPSTTERAQTISGHALPVNALLFIAGTMLFDFLFSAPARDGFNLSASCETKQLYPYAARLSINAMAG